MRVAVVAPLVTAIAEPQLGGSQALVADISRGLTERGHSVDVFAARGSRIEGVTIVDTGIDPGVLAPTLYRAGRDEAPSSALARGAFAGVYEAVTSREYDVVHNHAFDAPAIELAGRVDAPVVHSLHLGPDRQIAEALVRVRSEPRPPVVACVSDWLARAWAQTVSVDCVLRNGVPVDRIEWSEQGGDAALFAGRFSPEKGVREAIEIALGADVPIVVVGNAYDAGYANDIVERYGGRDDVEIRDAVPRHELWKLMARSLAVLCPVGWDEPFGLVPAEAQAAGTPVIAYSRGALPEVIVDGVTGALVADEDEAVVALRDAQRYNRSAIRAHAERNLSLEQTLDAHEALYAKISPPLSAELG